MASVIMARPQLGRLSLSYLSKTAAAAAAAPAPVTITPFLSQQSSPFSTTQNLCKRRRHKTRDNNRLRGVSSMRRSGPREFLSVSNDALPRPRAAKDLPPIQVDADHGLWEFFYDGKLMQPPLEDSKHGRPWTVEELRKKSWDDLHKLWWVCVKERNRIATAAYARTKNDIGFGSYESGNRDSTVYKTMKGIKHVLTERYYAWEDAHALAQDDPEINLDGSGPTFAPQAYLEEDLSLEEATGEAAQGQGAAEGVKDTTAADVLVDPSTIPVAKSQSAEKVR